MRRKRWSFFIRVGDVELSQPVCIQPEEEVDIEDGRMERTWVLGETNTLSHYLKAALPPDFLL